MKALALVLLASVCLTLAAPAAPAAAAAAQPAADQPAGDPPLTALPPPDEPQPAKPDDEPDTQGAPKSGSAHQSGKDLAPNISPPNTWLPRGGAVLRVLDKLNSNVRTVRLRVGETATIKSLSITLLGCAVRPDDLPQDATAHLKVADAADSGIAYDNWILSAEPSLNIFEHPVYDVHLANCA